LDTASDGNELMTYVRVLFTDVSAIPLIQHIFIITLSQFKG